MKPGYGWEQARRHYKLLSQRCHPDRYQRDPQAKAVAERRQRALNFAMRVLADYHRAHGRMPLPARPRLSHPRTSGVDERYGSSAYWRRGAPGGRSRFWTVLLMVAPVAAVVWLLLNHEGENPSGRSEKQSAAISSRLSSGRVDIRSQPRRFAVGDTPAVVRMVEGEPAYIEGNGWHYGRSVVYFREGRVAGWLSHADRPLQVSSSRPAGVEAPYIDVGSSAAEVLRIQGEPLFRSATRWDYGPSHIEFRDDRVSGWYSSPLRPLRVKE